VRVRLGLLVLAASGLLLAASAAAAVPTSFPGADLVPLRGMAYHPRAHRAADGQALAPPTSSSETSHSR
jgi:hypothetical protein